MEQNLHIDMDIKEVSKLAFERIMKQKRIFFSSQKCINYLKDLPNCKIEYTVWTRDLNSRMRREARS